MKIPVELRSRVRPSCSPPAWRTLTGTRTGTRWRERLSLDVVVVFSAISCEVYRSLAGQGTNRDLPRGRWRNGKQAGDGLERESGRHFDIERAAATEKWILRSYVWGYS